MYGLDKSQNLQFLVGLELLQLVNRGRI